MKRCTRYTIALFALLACLATVPDAGAIGDLNKIPAKRWLDGERGYEEALEIEKNTGADIIVYFFRYDIKNEKGLCRWWEKYGLTGDVKGLLKDYIKVEMQMPFRKSEEKTFADFWFKSCPAVFVVWPNGWKKKINPFDWPNGEPDLKEQEDLVNMIIENSSPEMQERVRGD